MGTHACSVTSGARGRRGAAAAHPVSQGSHVRPQPRCLPTHHQHKPGLALGSLTHHPGLPHSLEELCNDHREARGVKGGTQARKASRRVAELLPQPEETGAGAVST